MQKRGEKVATRKVVLSVCDRCTVEVSTPLSRKYKKGSDLVLPKGWLHVAGNTATALVFEMDLCTDCKQIVIEAAGQARRIHSTTSSAKPHPKAPASMRQEAQDLVGVG